MLALGDPVLQDAEAVALDGDDVTGLHRTGVRGRAREDHVAGDQAVARDVAERVGDPDVAGRLADDDRHLALVVEVAGAARPDDHALVAVERGRRLEEGVGRGRFSVFSSSMRFW
jgi:hypothetical protein